MGIWDSPTQNARDLRSKVVQVFANNQAFLANGSPSAADVLAQVRALTRQMNGLIRLEFGQLDDISDT